VRAERAPDLLDEYSARNLAGSRREATISSASVITPITPRATARVTYGLRLAIGHAQVYTRMT
jgi:hypothetical protein